MPDGTRIESREALRLAASRAEKGADELRAIDGSGRTLDLVQEAGRELRSMLERVEKGLDGHADPC